MESVSISTSLIEKHRQINVEHDWWEFVYEEFKERMAKVGIEVDKIYFSGFWSQGDGACFEGTINPLRFFRKHFPQEYPTIRLVLRHGGTARISCRHSGHYYHEHSTSFSIDYDMPSNVMPTPTDFHELIVEGYDASMELEMSDFETQSVELFRKYMRELYRELEKEYDNLTSDEAVMETIVANSLHEEIEDGDRESVL